MEKKVFTRIKAMAVITSLIVVTLFCGCGKDEGKDDPNLGLYTAQYGNVKSEHKYYDFEYIYEVDGMEYGGEKSNIEDYYGDTFEVLYDTNNPEKHVIGEEATFPIGLYLASLFVLGLFGFTVYKIIAEN